MRINDQNLETIVTPQKPVTVSEASASMAKASTEATLNRRHSIDDSREMTLELTILDGRLSMNDFQ